MSRLIVWSGVQFEREEPTKNGDDEDTKKKDREKLKGEKDDK